MRAALPETRLEKIKVFLNRCHLILNRYIVYNLLDCLLIGLINALFMTVNPIPVKSAMAMLGMCADELRLPLCTMTDAENEKLKKVLDSYGGRLK